MNKRAAFAVAVMLGAGLIAVHAEFVAHARGADFYVMYRAAKIVLGAGDPYQLIHPMIGDGGDALLATYWAYPLPAIGFALPFVWLRPEWATIAFVVCSAGLLAYAITRDGFARAPIVLSVPFVFACKGGQMSTMTLALALIPAAAGLSVMKPNLGLALFAQAPRWWTALTGGALLIGSILVAPSWPMEWYATVKLQPNYHPPAFVLGGVLVLVAALRWRQPAARLLLAMAIIPHALFFYDELPLWLIPDTHRESMTLTWCSWLAAFGWFATNMHWTANQIDLRAIAPWLVWLLYLPALVMVLRRPNEGPVPAWLNRLAMRRRIAAVHEA